MLRLDLSRESRLEDEILTAALTPGMSDGAGDDRIGAAFDDGGKFKEARRPPFGCGRIVEADLRQFLEVGVGGVQVDAVMRRFRDLKDGVRDALGGLA